MRPSEALDIHRDAIRRIVVANNAANPRVFGSSVHGDDTGESDIDILVDPIEGQTTVLNIIKIRREIEKLTGFPTDVLTPKALHEGFRQKVLDEAAPL